MTAMQVAFAPVFLHFLGIEAFGLIGAWLTLHALFAVLDLGISTTINREFARLSVEAEAGQEMRHLLRTLECLYWPIALVIGAAVFILAPWLANSWLTGVRVDPATTHNALILIGVALALQWSYDLYAGALLGLQRHVPLNIVLVVIATLRGAGAALVLWLVSPSILAFFAWQAACSALQTVLPALLAWRELPGSDRPRYRPDLVRKVRGFAGGVLGISVLGAVLTQMDKIVVSEVLSLEAFGRYTLAGLVAASLSRVAGPIFTSLFPRLSEQVARNDLTGVSDLYHRGTQLVSVLIFPLALVLALFSGTVLRIWTQDAHTAELTATTMGVLLIGTALNGIMHMPYALQLAHGWTQLAFRINLAAVLILAPLAYVATRSWGMVGAAGVWSLLNAGYLIVGVQLMHRRLLRAEQWRWYRDDVFAPLAAALAVVAPVRFVIGDDGAGLAAASFLIAVWILAAIAALLAAGQIRPWLAGAIRSYKLAL